MANLNLNLFSEFEDGHVHLDESCPTGGTWRGWPAFPTTDVQKPS